MPSQTTESSPTGRSGVPGPTAPTGPTGPTGPVEPRATGDDKGLAPPDPHPDEPRTDPIGAKGDQSRPSLAEAHAASGESPEDAAHRLAAEAKKLVARGDIAPSADQYLAKDTRQPNPAFQPTPDDPRGEHQPGDPVIKGIQTTYGRIAD